MAGITFWPKNNLAGAEGGAAGFARWLVDTAALWTIVEAYDADCATTKRRVPTGGSENTLDNAAFLAGSDFGWQLGTLGVGDWVVIQSTGAGHNCQVYIEVDSSTSIKWALIPDDANFFTTGGADVTPPNAPNGFPTTAIGTTLSGSPTLVSVPTLSGAQNFTAVCDEKTIIFFVDGGATANRKFMYIGGVDTSHPDDDVPFVIWDTPLYCYTTAGAYMNKLSHVDHATLLAGSLLHMGYGSSLPTDAGHDGLNNKWAVWPLGWHMPLAGHMVAGMLKFLYMSGADLAGAGTLDGMTYMYQTSNSAEPGLCVDWDGVTAYP